MTHEEAIKRYGHIAWSLIADHEKEYRRIVCSAIRSVVNCSNYDALVEDCYGDVVIWRMATFVGTFDCSISDDLESYVRMRVKLDSIAWVKDWLAKQTTRNRVYEIEPTAQEVPEIIKAMRREFVKLRGRERDIMVLRYFAGLKDTEIGEKLNLHRHTVRRVRVAVLFRFKHQLRLFEDEL